MKKMMYLKTSSCDKEDVFELFEELCKAMKKTSAEVRSKILGHTKEEMKKDLTMNDLFDLIEKSKIHFDLKIIFPEEVEPPAGIPKKEKPVDVSDNIKIKVDTVKTAPVITERKPEETAKSDEDDLPDF